MTTSTTNNKLIDKLKGSGARRLQGPTVAAAPTSAPLSVVHARCSLHRCHLDAGLEPQVHVLTLGLRSHVLADKRTVKGPVRNQFVTSQRAQVLYSPGGNMCRLISFKSNQFSACLLKERLTFSHPVLWGAPSLRECRLHCGSSPFVFLVLWFL